MLTHGLKGSNARIDATATANDNVCIGNTFVVSIKGQVGWGVYSDGRFKENIKEDVHGLDFINRLRPVTYQVNREAIDDFTGVTARRAALAKENNTPVTPLGNKLSKTTTGFIAQEVEQAAKEIGFDFSGVEKPQNVSDLYSIRYAEFVVPLVKAVQQLSAQDEKQKQELVITNKKAAAQEKIISDLLIRIAVLEKK